MRILGKHMDVQTGSRADNKRLSSHLHTCTDTWRNVRNARRKDEGQWEYKEVHLLGGGGGGKNRAIKPSCQAKNLLMAHIHIRKLSETKENLSHRAIASPFYAWFCPESSPLHLSSAPPTHVRRERVINV